MITVECSYNQRLDQYDFCFSNSISYTSFNLASIKNIAVKHEISIDLAEKIIIFLQNSIRIIEKERLVAIKKDQDFSKTRTTRDLLELIKKQPSGSEFYVNEVERDNINFFYKSDSEIGVYLIVIKE